MVETIFGLLIAAMLIALVFQLNRLWNDLGSDLSDMLDQMNAEVKS